MIGLIEDWAGEEHAGKWDVTTIPGGAGNWGGSYLGVPAQTDHPEEAYELAKFLTSPEGHLLAYEEVGAMPSSLAALEDRGSPTRPTRTSVTPRSARSSADSVRGLEPIHLGGLHQQTWENIFEPAMQRVEAGPADLEEAFEQAVQEALALQ